MITNPAFALGNTVQVIDPEEITSEWATFIIIDKEADRYLLKSTVDSQGIDDQLKAKLSELGVRLNATLKKIIASKTEQQINNALGAVEEYLANGKKVKSKAGLLRKALEENWMPNLTDEERKVNQVNDIFSEWFKLAKDQGIVQAR